MRRTARPIPIGVLVEHRLHHGLQVRAHDRLRDPIRDGRDGGIKLHLLQP